MRFRYVHILAHQTGSVWFLSLQSFQNQLSSLAAQANVQPLIREKMDRMTELHDQLGRLQMQQRELAEEKVHYQREAEREG